MSKCVPDNRGQDREAAMRAYAILAGLMIAGVATPSRAEDCFTFETAATLQGKIAAVEDYLVLQVSPAICVELPPGDDLGMPAHNVQEVQIVGESTAAARALTGQIVTISGHLSPPHGDMNRRPVILEAELVRKK